MDEVLNSPPAPFSAAEAGDTFRVDYVLDISTPDLDGIDDLGTFSGAIESYTVTIGGVSASTDLGGVNTANSGPFSPEDTYAVVGLFAGYTTSLAFTDASGTAFDADDDLSEIDLSGFNDRTFILLNGIFPSVTGTLASATVPEPRSSLLFGIACVATAFTRRRR